MISPAILACAPSGGGPAPGDLVELEDASGTLELEDGSGSIQLES